MAVQPELKMRIVVFDGDIRKVTTTKPDTLEDLIGWIKNFIQADYSFCLHYEDPEFNNELCNLTNISEFARQSNNQNCTHHWTATSRSRNWNMQWNRQSGRHRNIVLVFLPSWKKLAVAGGVWDPYIRCWCGISTPPRQLFVSQEWRLSEVDQRIEAWNPTKAGWGHLFIEVLVNEMMKRNPNMLIVKKEMDMTFGLRRKEVVQGKTPIAQICHRWPALFTDSQVCMTLTSKRFLGSKWILGILRVLQDFFRGIFRGLSFRIMSWLLLFDMYCWKCQLMWLL